ncbi:MAG: type II/IV secretion system protein [Candidatus Magasanikbacteria bacterium]|nr:type II/IV secretion system protein [Candidatus Magasanikbacteria bacterium]
MAGKKKPLLHLSSKATEEAFSKKMEEVAVKDKEKEVRQFARHSGYSYIDLEHFPIGHEALRQVPEAQARELQAVCFFATQDEVRIGAVNPEDPAVQELLYQVGERMHANGKLYTISQRSLDYVFVAYAHLPVVEPIKKDVAISQEDLEQVQASVTDFSSFGTLLSKKTTTDLVTFIMGAGLKLGASDVHIEAEEEKIMVRFRLDGILHDAATLPKKAYKQLISRLKLLSSLKINVVSKPQDGRFSVKLEEGGVDVRVSTIPTMYGESVVMRLLVQNRSIHSLGDLGLRGRSLKRLQKEILRPNGMIITTGPTGSGKTTTLYAIMRLLNKPDVKIITLEDPVEYKMDGVNQSQIDKSKEYTFASGLRSMLRQDPDIAMVGEIRDLETADIAIQAALTGHLMLSTIHTNDAFGAIPRFLSMGVKPFLLAPALNCVIGQRLVRRLCESCKKEASLTADLEERVEKILHELPELEKKEMPVEKKFYTAGGCEECSGIGYKGRLGIYEVFIINDQIEQSILGGNVAESDIKHIAVDDGVVTMEQDGVLKAMDGMTSIEEVFRVI